MVNLIKCIITGAVAGFAMATEQAALWLTWPALFWSLGNGAIIVDQLLMEGRY